ncbi:6538_t:CDS:1, partial [Gigaspora rosea]
DKCPVRKNDGWEENEVYALGENRYQPYAEGSKRIVQGKPESRWENRLRGHENLGPQP